MKQNDKAERKRSYSIAGGCLALAYALCCFVISPMYFRVSSDISYAKTVTPALVQYFGIVTELAAISVFYGIMIYGIYRFGISNFRLGVVIFAMATAFKYGANVVVTWITYQGSIPTSWPWDLANILFYTALELIQLWIIIAISKRIISKSSKADEGSDALPSAKSDPIVKCALVCGIITVVAKFIGRFADDAWMIILSGLPKDPMTLVFMALSYASIVVMGVICYFITVATAGRMKERSGAK